MYVVCVRAFSLQPFCSRVQCVCFNFAYRRRLAMCTFLMHFLHIGRSRALSIAWPCANVRCTSVGEILFVHLTLWCVKRVSAWFSFDRRFLCVLIFVYICFRCMIGPCVCVLWIRHDQSHHHLHMGKTSNYTAIVTLLGQFFFRIFRSIARWICYDSGNKITTNHWNNVGNLYVSKWSKRIRFESCPTKFIAIQFIQSISITWAMRMPRKMRSIDGSEYRIISKSKFEILPSLSKLNSNQFMRFHSSDDVVVTGIRLCCVRIQHFPPIACAAHHLTNSFHFPNQMDAMRTEKKSESYQKI